MESRSRLSREELVDKIKGCIYGNALGDAFGLATEFMSKEQARLYYGVGPIKFGRDSGYDFVRDRHRSRWHENDFTDDTDQMLVILQCVLETKGILSAKRFAKSLKNWADFGFPNLRKMAFGIGFTVGSTFSHPDFYSNPHKAAYDVWNANKRNLAANGAVMRTSVLGIPYFHEEQTVVQNAMNAAKVTHADPRSVLSAVIVSVLVSRMLCGVSSVSTEGLNHETRSECEKFLLHGVNGCDAEEDEDTAGDDESLEVDQGNENLERDCRAPTRLTIFERCKVFLFGKKKNSYEEQQSKYDMPAYPLFLSANAKPAAMSKNVPASMDTFGDDENMMKLCREVVDTYKFLLEGNSLCQQNTEEECTDWTTELELHCFPKSLADLKLDDRKSMGYTFKCLGAGLYCFTRAIPKKMSPAHFFKTVITELTLEGGDADTNCAVAGALLGCRFGLSNLPIEWLDGLRHTAYLDNATDQLCSLVLSSND